jgi:hypothetical protein
MQKTNLFVCAILKLRLYIIGELACFVLTEAAFEQLKASHLAIAINPMSNLAREVSGRLRRATRTIRHLVA